MVVRTGCRRSASAGTAPGGPGGTVYRIDLAAEPVDGRANDELARFLASEFGTGRDAVEIRSGRSSRRKLVRIGDPPARPPWFAG